MSRGLEGLNSQMSSQMSSEKECAKWCALAPAVPSCSLPCMQCLPFFSVGSSFHESLKVPPSALDATCYAGCLARSSERKPSWLAAWCPFVVMRTMYSVACGSLPRCSRFRFRVQCRRNESCAKITARHLQTSLVNMSGAKGQPLQTYCSHALLTLRISA